ncbi:Hypothetical predicted protein [Octopus vulgaris]|uniref:Uncharacterized protein n=1 Tax=Octopus vulgaris TaxID=6645 RepID=A0AA36F3Q5_OCTVU|nr:Hypothetical predicted protein [Octopus vulgaris]
MHWYRRYQSNGLQRKRIIIQNVFKSITTSSALFALRSSITEFTLVIAPDNTCSNQLVVASNVNLRQLARRQLVRRQFACRRPTPTCETEPRPSTSGVAAAAEEAGDTPSANLRSRPSTSAASRQATPTSSARSSAAAAESRGPVDSGSDFSDDFDSSDGDSGFEFLLNSDSDDSDPGTLQLPRNNRRAKVDGPGQQNVV